MDIYNLVSFCGIFVLLGFTWLLSNNKKNMNWRVIFWGTTLQIIFAAFIFLVPQGTKLFLFVNDAVIKILDTSTAGANFVFGRLALAPGQTNQQGETSLGFILAFQGFPTIIFFSALISILYYFNIMNYVIKGFAYIFTGLMRVSGAESLVTASNIFAGVESNLTVKPYISQMTRSEFCTILTAGMATVASNVMALYVFTLKGVFPAIAGHLVSASILAAPASLVMSKIIFPETETPQTLGLHIQPFYEKEKSFFEAIINASLTGVKMIVGIAALLIAVLGLVALADMLLSLVALGINSGFGCHLDLSLKTILGLVFYPFTFILGIHPSDVLVSSKIIGERSVLTELVSYKDLAAALDAGLLQHKRSAVIITYALCGFAHLASVAIFVGGTTALAPNRTRDIASVSLRALIAATLACLMTAAVAGTFATENSILF
jgi:CNT family concentrative nucleoside transporter